MRTLAIVDRIDAGSVVVGVVCAIALIPFTDVGGFFVGFWAIVAGVTGLIAVNHTVPRRPHLVVEYRNPLAEDRPVVWSRSTDAGKRDKAFLLVYLRNTGRGVARSIEVRFDSGWATHVFNETGNGPDPELDTSVSPYQYKARDRVLNPGQEWCIARLTWMGSEPKDCTAAWGAWAEGAPKREGVVRIVLE